MTPTRIGGLVSEPELRASTQPRFAHYRRKIDVIRFHILQKKPKRIIKSISPINVRALVWFVFIFAFVSRCVRLPYALNIDGRIPLYDRVFSFFATCHLITNIVPPDGQKRHFSNTQAGLFSQVSFVTHFCSNLCARRFFKSTACLRKKLQGVYVAKQSTIQHK